VAPSRSERNAIREPSGDTEGAPPCVTGGGFGCAERAPASAVDAAAAWRTTRAHRSIAFIISRGSDGLVKRFAALLLALAAPALGQVSDKPSGPASTDKPSRPASKGCRWEKASNASVGLEAWVERCDYGYRKIDFLFTQSSLAMRFSDGGGQPDPVVDVLDL